MDKQKSRMKWYRNRDIFHDFMKDTPSPGFRNIYRSQVCWRLLWIVFMLVAWNVTGYQTALQIMTYLKYETNTAVTIAISQNMTFPELLICNLNMFKSSQLQAVMTPEQFAMINSNVDGNQFGNQFGGNYNNGVNSSPAPMPPQQPITNMQLPNMTTIASLLHVSTSQMNNSTQTTTLHNIGKTISDGRRKRSANLNTTSAPLTNQTRVDLIPQQRALALLQYFAYTYKYNFTALGHSMDTMLLQCSYQGDQCFSSNFTGYDDPIYGRCYAFVVDNSYSTYSGPNYGLSLILNVESEEYLELLSPSLGFQVSVGPSSYIPFPTYTGFAVSPGQQTKISLTQQVINRLPYPYNIPDCGVMSTVLTAQEYQYFTDAFNTINYTQEFCIKYCYSWAVEAACGCVDPSVFSYDILYLYFTLANMSMPIACDMSQQNVWNCVQNLTSSVVSGQICGNDKCPQPCTEVNYPTQVTGSSWPRVGSSDYVYFSSLITNTSDVTQHVVNLNIYFQDLTFEMVTESAAMTFMDLLSAVGGTFGLFIGACFLTLIEFLQLIFALIGWKKAVNRPNWQSIPLHEDIKENYNKFPNNQLTKQKIYPNHYDGAVSPIVLSNTVNYYDLA